MARSFPLQKLRIISREWPINQLRMQTQRLTTFLDHHKCLRLCSQSQFRSKLSQQSLKLLKGVIFTTKVLKTQVKQVSHSIIYLLPSNMMTCQRKLTRRQRVQILQSILEQISKELLRELSSTQDLIQGLKSKKMASLGKFITVSKMLCMLGI